MGIETVINNGVIPTICRQCDMHCGINVHIENGTVVKITGLDSHPENRGRVCPKGPAAVETVNHEERLLKPLKKTADGLFEKISLEQAMEEITAKLLEIKGKYGARSVGCWQGEALGFAQQEKYSRRFIHAFGSPNFFSADSLCWASRHLAYKLVQGYWNPCPDFKNADLIILWGSNPPVSHPTYMGPINEGRKRGAGLIVIDPRLTRVARQADIHLQLRPGSDGALALGLIRSLIESSSYDKDFVEHYSVGFEDLSTYVQKFTPKLVARKTGLKLEEIIECCRLIIKSLPRIANYVGVSLEHQDNGLNSIRAISSLACLCGAVDTQGADPWPEGMGERDLSLYDELPLKDQKPVGADKFPVLYDLVKECHTMTGMDYILGKGEYPLRALIVTGGNPVSTNPNSGKVARALSSLDLLVVRDLFLTETTELAHYVLPAASFLERSELHLYSHMQWAALSRKVMGITDVLDEYSFWRDLAGRLGFGDRYFPWKTEEEVNRWLLEPTGISLEELQKRPEGLRYRPIRYHKFRSRPFPTPSGKVEFNSRYLEDLGFPGLPEYTEPYYLRKPSEEYPFILISGARKLVLLHSRFRNIARFRRLHPRAEVEIHPDDAFRLGIIDKEQIKVVSETGSVTIAARIVQEKEIFPGVIQITHGWEKQSNVNRITFDQVNDPISGFPQLNSVPVRIEKLN